MTNIKKFLLAALKFIDNPANAIMGFSAFFVLFVLTSAYKLHGPIVFNLYTIIALVVVIGFIIHYVLKLVKKIIS